MTHAGNLGGRHQRLAAELAGTVQVRLQIVNLHVNSHDVVRLMAQGIDMSLDAGAGSRGNHERRTVLFHFPVKELAIKCLGCQAIAATDLEVYNGLTHGADSLMLESLIGNVIRSSGHCSSSS